MAQLAFSLRSEETALGGRSGHTRAARFRDDHHLNCQKLLQHDRSLRYSNEATSLEKKNYRLRQFLIQRHFDALYVPPAIRGIPPTITISFSKGRGLENK